MKKIIGILTILLTVVISSFGQTSVEKGGTVEFWLNGNQSGFSVNLDIGTKSVIIVYDEPLNVSSILSDGNNGLHTIVSITHKSIGVSGEGDYSTTIKYEDYGLSFINDDFSITTTAYTPVCEFVEQDTIDSFNNGYLSGHGDGFTAGVNSVTCEFTEQDTIDSYNSGVASVVCEFTEQDTIDSYNSGVASVVCEFTEQDTIDSYNSGVASVDTDGYYNDGYNNGYIAGEASTCDITEQDTINAYNNGVASVDTDAFYNSGHADGVASVDTDTYYNNGFTAGVASVDCDFTEQDTINSYNSGVASVDTDTYYNNGYTDGVASVDTDTYYNNGFTDGVASVDTDQFFNDGYDAGVVEGENTAAEDAYNDGYTDCSSTGINDFAVTNLSVYPNPISSSGVVTIDCDDFNNVKVYDITGVELYYSTSNTFNVSDFTTLTGIYVLTIEDDGFNITNKKLLVQ